MSAAPLQRVLALDSSTEHLSLALGSGQPGAPLWRHEAVGGAQASSALIPAILHLLEQAGWPLSSLDAIALGVGPGAFTGLRTACAVAQGLAVAARPGGIPVLPISTLAVVAETARAGWVAAGQACPQRLVVVLDARMDELYAAEYRWDPQAPHSAPRLLAGPWLCAPQDLAPATGWPSGATEPDSPALGLAGNALAQVGPRLAPAWAHVPQREAWPQAEALLRLAPAWWAQGLAVPAAQAQPLYVRDKVAQTTEERERLRAEREAMAAASGRQP